MQRNKTILLILLVVCVLGIFAYQFSRTQNKKKNIQEKNIPQTPAVKVSTSFYGSALSPMLAQSKLVFPAIASSSEVMLQEIPAQFTTLVLDGNKNLKSERLFFQNGQQGFRINYDVGVNLDKVFEDLNKINKEGTGFAGYAGKAQQAALIEREDKSYKIRVEIWFLDDNLSHIYIILAQ